MIFHVYMFLCFADFQCIYSANSNRDIMNILNFVLQFSDEVSCIALLKEQSGIVCKRCGCKDHTCVRLNYPLNADTAPADRPYAES